MKLLYESPMYGEDDSLAEAIIIYELTWEDWCRLDDLLYDGGCVMRPEAAEEVLADLGYYSDWGDVMPGASYERYYIEALTSDHLIISKHYGLNV